MIQNDFAGLALVYIYVAILLIISEKLLDKYPTFARKFLHIMTGNIAFLLPIFQTREIMAFLAAGPFILFTLLMSTYSPIKSIKGKTSSAGHGMGLVYYAVTWTILAYLFFDYKVVIAIGILAMSYGDGFASLIGSKYAKKRYKIYNDQKSYIGSFSMFAFSIIIFIVALIFYELDVNLEILFILVIIALSSTISEMITPKGLDNLSVPFIASIYFYVALFL
ncbi:phosphatidate cytidylyltransferase [Thermoplasmatales archaeon SG8-52-4]|nr:MAG: phosphatidate cytidylyltransferase [Thermoplasmatales archaeon SG8-52-4]